MEEEYRFYVGIDWGSQTHQACVLDHARGLVAERAFAHEGSAIAAFIEWLTELCGGNPAQVAIAIEIPRGPVVEALVERGFHLYAINPKQLDRFRDRHTVAGAKDDRRDAFVLADSVRTDRPCFRRVRLEDPLVIQLRELTRIDEELEREERQLGNRLRDQLHRFYAQALKLCPAADQPWLWALLELAPTPKAARRLSQKRVERLLRQHRIRRLNAQEVVAQLRTPALQVAPGVVAAATEHIALLLPRLRLVHDQRRSCGARVEALLKELERPSSEEEDENGPVPSDVAIIRSSPGIGKMVCARMLAEASVALAERDYQAMRAHGGIAPITKQSGKQKMVLMRYACNGRLRNALYHWARVAVMLDPSSQSYYRALRQRGRTHGRALRAVADRLLRILIAMLKSKTLFDPSRARCAQAPTASEKIVEKAA